MSAAATRSIRRSIRSSRLAHGVMVGLALFTGSMAGSAEQVEPTVPVVAFLVRTPELDGAAAFRSLGRTSILGGRTEFLAVASDPDALRVTRLEVLSDAVLLDGRQLQICQSTVRPDACSYTFEGPIRGQALTLVARLQDRQTGEQRMHTERITTLRTHAGREQPGLGSTALVERTGVRSTPRDYLTRAVHVTRLEGSRSNLRRIAVSGLEGADFAASAAGIGELDVLSVRPPEPAAPCIVPLLWNVSGYLKIRRGATAWTDDHDALVRRIREGLRAASRNGFDCSVLAVEYAAFGRPLFGPIHLTPGESLNEAERAENRRLLDELTRHLLAEPETHWLRVTPVANRPVWDSAFRDVYQTLNDLLRGYPATPAVLLLTDGNDEISRDEPTFQEQLWPSRIEEINAAWSPDRVAELLHELDSHTSWYDPLVDEFVTGLDANDPEAPAKIAAMISRLDPGGLASLQPHRKDVWPPIDVLITPNERLAQDRGLKGWLPMVGGRLWILAPDSRSERRSKLTPLAETGVFTERTVGEALLAVERRIRESYTVEVVVPNPDQDMSPHPLDFRLTERGMRRARSADSDRIKLDFMPSYFASPPLERKLPTYAASPFKVLRLLAAYHLRERPFDHRDYGLLRERWREEGDPQVRGVLFESWVSVQLQRLQVEPDDVRSQRLRERYVEGAWRNLQAFEDPSLPDPALYHAARQAAAWYHEQYPARFRSIQVD